MTPQAQLSAAIEVLDRILAGSPAELALTNWGRASRYAGSGDRHAVRDLVYDALRCKRSFAALGGANTGRGLILGGLRAQGLDVDACFTGEGHAPRPVSETDIGFEPSEAERLDCPDWLVTPLRNSLGPNFTAILQAMRLRAPVFVRVNQTKATLEQTRQSLATEGIATEPVILASFALKVTENARKIQRSQAFLSGWIELQDAASQAVIEALPLRDTMKVLDFCCGGGGKALAMAARASIELYCHDADPRRMSDLPDRAQRAGVTPKTLKTPAKAAPYDLVLTDVPCSGSGSWRRDPQGKWSLTPDRLTELLQTQASILQAAAQLVALDGTLAYATCSMLQDENEGQIQSFLAQNPQWICQKQQHFSPLQEVDGFFIALLTRVG